MALHNKWADQFAKTAVCPECHGVKLNKEALSFRIHDKNIYELSTMDINELYDWLVNVDPYLSRDGYKRQESGSLRRGAVDRKYASGYWNQAGYQGIWYLWA